MTQLGFTAIVAAYNREESTRTTVERLQSCVPPPAEIIVHLDSGADFPLPAGVRILRSERNIGPGGARNLMIREASHEWIASFDDDSYPETLDYFSRLTEATQRHPSAAILACHIRHRDPTHDFPVSAVECPIATFVGCGCVYRRSAFLATLGYIPLPVAYGMEEVDLALQLCAKNSEIIQIPGLKVFHDTNLAHHADPRITAGSIMNQALLAWLRYPPSLLPHGILQWFNKFWDCMKRGRVEGAIRGCVGTPAWLLKHRQLRAPVAREHLTKFRKLLNSGPGRLSTNTEEPLEAPHPS